MKNIYLLRHCQAEGGFGAPDKQRNLSAHGEAEAEALGRYLKAHNISFDRVFCSSAIRTCETLDHMVHGGIEIRGQVDFRDDLYNASAGQIYEAVKTAPNDCKHLLVIAHNPGIHEFSKFLTGTGNSHFLERQAYFAPPGFLSMLECPIDDWSALQPAANQLNNWIDPSLYLPADTSHLL